TGDETEGAGFFAEEDDDKIALTGDELNNIIHTADFTEETDAGENLNDDYTSPDDEPGETVDVSSGVRVENSGEDILRGGLGSPLNRASAECEEGNLELKDSDILKTLRKNGVEPMTSPPDDTSYLEEDPLGGEQLDLSDAIIDEPDLSEGINDAPLEEPIPDTLSLIDLDDMSDADIPKVNDNLFEDVSFDDIMGGDKAAAVETGPVDSDFTEVSFDEPLSIGAEDKTPLEISEGEPGFEMLNEDAKLPLQGNVITGDSFESISPDDDGEEPAAEADADIEQTDDMNIELDLPPLDLPAMEIDNIFNELEPDDKNFDGPGAVDTADAGDPTIDSSVDFSIEIPTQPDPGMEVPSAIKIELKNVLAYLDKLLESLPEEKIEEFAKSEYFDTYKKLFEELGIS
ncbi:MAG: hypothetical protein LBR99_03440, partial [Treponema sp.]|nr:hypothetical protein [Treponema sp.]